MGAAIQMMTQSGASMCGGNSPHSHGCNALIHNSEDLYMSGTCDKLAGKEHVSHEW